MPDTRRRNQLRDAIRDAAYVEIMELGYKPSTALRTADRILARYDRIEADHA